VAELVIEGGTPLRGTLTPSGNKNAAFPLIAAALLTDQPVTLRNLSDISDVRTMLEAMEGLGVDIGRHDRHTVTLRAVALRSTAPDPALLRRIRGALVLLGPLLARERQVRFGTSGGDQIGRPASTAICSACRPSGRSSSRPRTSCCGRSGCRARTSCSTRPA
jgi:UDP-N-acetylglucosamine 1-carboxyvinyltransferase